MTGSLPDDSLDTLQFRKTKVDRDAEPLWTVMDVSRYLQLKPNTVRAMARREELPGLKIGRSWRFKKSLIVDCLKEK